MTDTSSAVPGEFLLYETEDGRTRVECRFVDDSLWLPQAGMAELFQTTPQNITLHLKALYAEGEIILEATCKDDLQVRSEGGRQVRRLVKFYNLDAILAVGYRVRSPRGTQFRRWATERLREYLVKGFTLDDERLKNPPVAGSAVPDRFEELLERIRDIRASERRMYLRVREIFAMAADYSPSLPETTQLFQVIQNKLHFTVTGKTAAELIAQRANSGVPNMGLTTWKSGSVQKADVKVAKNYLNEQEVSELNTHCHDVAGLRRRPGAPSQRGVLERLGRAAGCLPEVQRARCAGGGRQDVQEAGRRPCRSPIRSVCGPAQGAA